MSRRYPAKLLLFGEYTVLNGSQALAVPLHNWSGQWQTADVSLSPSPVDYYRWLLASELIDERIYTHMIDDHTDAWQYTADIPMGYGLGSSGAYVAAVFDRYFPDELKRDVHYQTHTLAKMEAWFHGASSGMDPLVSYRDHAVFKDDLGTFHCIEDPGWPATFNVYLLDSGISRQTGPLVKKYGAMMETGHFLSQVKRELLPMVDHAIHFYLHGQSEMLATCIQTISLFQRTYLQDMIPIGVRSIWDELSAMPGTNVKLCGAGGGGFFLVTDTQGHDLTQHYPLIRVSQK